MARVTYKGDHAAVFVVVGGAPIVEAKHGEPVDVPAGLATDLLRSPVWVARSQAASQAEAQFKP